MDRTTNAERRAAEVLVGTLEEMLTELAATTGDGDVAWLRPLAVLSAEIEYSGVRSPQADAINLALGCRELSHLLVGSPGDGGEFASAYATARRASPAIAALHDRALAACRTLMARHAPAGWTRDA
jgi:hypothetical protein